MFHSFKSVFSVVFFCNCVAMFVTMFLTRFRFLNHTKLSKIRFTKFNSKPESEIN